MNIATMRKTRGLSQKWLADKLGVDVSLVSKMENGSRPVSEEMKSKIEAIFAEQLQKPDEFEVKSEESGVFSPRFTVALQIMTGMASGVDIYGSERPGYYERVVNAAFALADKMLEQEERNVQI